MLALLRAILRIPHRPESPTAALGRAGEKAAARHLRRAGYRILGRNVRVRIGEADLVCLDPDGITVVIVEVKTRRTHPGPAHAAAPPPEANVDARKRRKLIAVARYLARANGWTGRPIRIDVIAVEWPAHGTPTLRHHPGAVTSSR